jgi:chemotaxis protein MotB
MSGEDQQSPHELVIIKRRSGGHDDGHHGGAWKIAFADFMTALMCFFLVMWLINATDKKTVTQVAAYFNPLRLNDRLPTVKGLHDPAPHDAKPDATEGKEDGKKPAKAAKSKSAAKSSPPADSPAAPAPAKFGTAEQRGDAELLRDPYGVLERIAAGDQGAKVERRLPVADNSTQGLPADSFDPTSSARPAQIPGSAPSPITTARAPKSDGASPKNEAVEAGAATNNGVKSAMPQPLTTANEIERRIGKALSELKEEAIPGIEIKDTKSEILISLTDRFDLGMFAVSSARPTSALIGVMERVAKVLADTSGSVTIRGHTDARKFRETDNDNWRLSMARAQMAYYMLIRGGLAENRIKRLEGYADRSLKDPANPLAAQNRRIEILIAKGET